MENEHFCKIIALFSKLHKIYFRSYCAKFAYELINVLLIKSSIKMVNDLNLGPMGLAKMDRWLGWTFRYMTT